MQAWLQLMFQCGCCKKQEEAAKLGPSWMCKHAGSGLLGWSLTLILSWHTRDVGEKEHSRSVFCPFPSPFFFGRKKTLSRSRSTSCLPARQLPQSQNKGKVWQLVLWNAVSEWCREMTDVWDLLSQMGIVRMNLCPECAAKITSHCLPGWLGADAAPAGTYLVRQTLSLKYVFACKVCLG